MPKLTSSEFAEKWGRRLKGSVEDIRRGIDKVTEAPGAKAAAKKSKWVAKMTSAEVQEKWARNIASVSLEEWKRKARDIGANRISAGVDGAQDKVAQFAEQLLSYQEANLGKIKSMPDITLSDSKARMDAWFDVMSKFKFKK